MAGIGPEGTAYQMQCAILAVQPAPAIWAVEKPDPWQRCRFLEPLPVRGAHHERKTISRRSEKALIEVQEEADMEIPWTACSENQSWSNKETTW